MPKAPRWLTDSFAQGIDERELLVFDASEAQCWLAQFDPAHRPCEGRFERFHFVPRQRVEHAIGALLPGWIDITQESAFRWRTAAEEEAGDLDDVIHLAAWDCRNGGIACEQHHRRFDKHLVSLPSEQIAVPRSALPEHVEEFASDWGLGDELEARFES